LAKQMSHWAGVGLLLISLAVIALQRQVAALEWWRKKHYEAFMLLFELRKMDAESDIKEDAKQHVNN